MQSTGHSSIQVLSFRSTHGNVITYVIVTPYLPADLSAGHRQPSLPGPGCPASLSPAAMRSRACRSRSSVGATACDRSSKCAPCSRVRCACKAAAISSAALSAACTASRPSARTPVFSAPTWRFGFTSIQLPGVIDRDNKSFTMSYAKVALGKNPLWLPPRLPAPTSRAGKKACIGLLQRVLVRGKGDATRRLWKADHEHFTIARGIELNAFAWIGPDSGQGAELKAVAGERASRGKYQRGPL